MKLERRMRVWLVDVVFANGPRVREILLADAPDLIGDGAQAFTTEAEALECAIEIIETERARRNGEAESVLASLNGRLREVRLAVSA